jgi:hypothetical protein
VDFKDPNAQLQQFSVRLPLQEHRDLRKLLVDERCTLSECMRAWVLALLNKSTPEENKEALDILREFVERKRKQRRAFVLDQREKDRLYNELEKER